MFRGRGLSFESIYRLFRSVLNVVEVSLPKPVTGPVAGTTN